MAQKVQNSSAKLQNCSCHPRPAQRIVWRSRYERLAVVSREAPPPVVPQLAVKVPAGRSCDAAPCARPVALHGPKRILAPRLKRTVPAARTVAAAPGARLCCQERRFCHSVAMQVLHHHDDHRRVRRCLPRHRHRPGSWWNRPRVTSPLAPPFRPPRGYQG